MTTLGDGPSGSFVFQSTSPYSSLEALNGSGGAAESVTVSGDLTMPEGRDEGERIPAMVMVHGSGGPGSANPAWGAMFQELGIATFEVDSFTGRGVSRTVGDQSRVRATMMASDAFNALKLLATHPRIDPERIGIIGWSKGGAVSFFTAWEPRRQSEIDDDLAFALHIPLYPPCAQFDRFAMTGKPLLLLLGEKDNWTPKEPCLRMADGMRAAGTAVDIEVYSGAHHSFDSTRTRVGPVADARSVRNCDFRVAENGSEYEATTGGAMDDPDGFKEVVVGCTEKGSVTAGGNATARENALEDARTFVMETFGL